VQLQKEAKRVKIYSRRGADFTERYASIADALLKLPAKQIVIDAELVVLREDGTSDFAALHTRRFDPAMLCAWYFDLLGHAGKDMREMPLMVRKRKLGTILRGSVIQAPSLSVCR
jgi:ATP-dependent DNA ligase